ncbi:urea transporter 2 isoform X1 [Folsomia candida]|uniref:urea transporter 2 isoform X1 n=1 Tax=Folsomia candida TaxID=158441 RepID=UPI0016054E18|nr:urea transporter 2 isoform X1 [Folsomia candida]
MEKETKSFKCMACRAFDSKWIQILGDCPAVDECLKKKKGCCWNLLNFYNCFARGLSQIAFANNPITGTLVLLALFAASPTVGVGGLVGASVSVLTAMAFGIQKPLITSGLTTYNGALVGIITTSLLPLLYSKPVTLYVWMFIIFGASLSVIINSCIDNLFSSSQKNVLPPLTLTFNAIQLLMFVCLMSSNASEQEHGATVQDISTKTQETYPIPTSNSSATALFSHQNSAKHIFAFPKIIFSHFRYRQIFPADNFHSPGGRRAYTLFAIGVVLSVGQVHGLNDLWASVIIMLGIFIYSPIHLVTGIIGAGLGSTCGILLANEDFDDVYNGLWGYNGFLASVAISSIFFLPSIRSFIVAGANVVTAALVQKAFQLGFKQLNLPYLTVPYVLTTLIFLQAKVKDGSPIRIKNISYPEKHLYEHYVGMRKDSSPHKDQEMSCDACRSTSNAGKSQTILTPE